jgi:hypothetical protein
LKIASLRLNRPEAERLESDEAGRLESLRKKRPNRYSFNLLVSRLQNSLDYKPPGIPASRLPSRRPPVAFIARASNLASGYNV